MPYQHTDPVALWAEGQITVLDAGDLPQYGSRAWRELSAEDPRRVGAILTAAEQWRRQQVEQEWLDQLADEDPVAWWVEITQDAEAEARRVLRRLQPSRQPTWAQIRERRAKHGPVHELRATSGWPPIAIPGRPGWHRHLIDGRQVDRTSTPQETAA